MTNPGQGENRDHRIITGPNAIQLVTDSCSETESINRDRNLLKNKKWESCNMYTKHVFIASNRMYQREERKGDEIVFFMRTGNKKFN